MQVVSIESPYSNSNPQILHRNICYAILALKDSTLNYGEASYASHLLNTQCVSAGQHLYVDDKQPDKFGVGRDQAIAITNTMRMKADKIVLYTDFGISMGMQIAKDIGNKYQIPVIERQLPKIMMDELPICD